ncbi:MAG: hypothetical protein L0027_15945 [Candidatus Rokubacteria bacterium]|nr:hypothetical protein [Candidatus Rokubacteria bacterium]
MPPILRPPLLVPALVLLAGCAGPTLPYRPDQQPGGAQISANYRLLGDRLKIEVDTDGRQLESARIVRADGVEVPAQTIEYPAPDPWYSRPPVGVGVGAIGSGSRVAGGAGVTFAIPLGGSEPPSTTATYFPLEQAGAGPWRLVVKLAGLAPAIIVVGAPPGPGARP